MGKTSDLKKVIFLECRYFLKYGQKTLFSQWSKNNVLLVGIKRVMTKTKKKKKNRHYVKNVDIFGNMGYLELEGIHKITK